jgi:hypothetical protein
VTFDEDVSALLDGAGLLWVGLGDARVRFGIEVALLAGTGGQRPCAASDLSKSRWRGALEKIRRRRSGCAIFLVFHCLNPSSMPQTNTVDGVLQCGRALPLQMDLPPRSPKG